MASAKENLEDFITCSVCLEKFEGRDPRLLPCGHAFCVTCIQDIHRTAITNTNIKFKDDEFRCPQCTSMSNIPGKSVINYPKFFHATHMHDILAEISKSSNPSHIDWGVCQNDQDEVAGYCFTCKMSYCDQCLQSHKTTRRFNNHIYVKVNKANITSLICIPHDKPYDAYCTECSKALCAQCQLSDHKDHSISDFVVNRQTPDHFPDFTIKSSKDKIQHIIKLQKELSLHTSFTHVMISKQEEMLITQIKDKSKSLHAKLTKHHADTNKELEIAKQRLIDFDNLLDQARIQMAQFKQPIPELPSISLLNDDTLISDIQRQIPEEPPNIRGISKYLFTPRSNDLTLGTLSKLAQQLMEINMDKETNDICWTPAGDLLATRLNKLVMYNKQGENVPCGVPGVHEYVLAATTQQSMIALIEGSRVSDHHLFIKSLTIARPMRHLCKLPDYSYCVRFTAVGEILVGEKTVLLKYNKKGKMLWMRETQHKAKYITTTPDDKIIISGDRQLSVHDKDGQWLTFFPKDPSTLPCPQGLCSDSCGNVFVADSRKRAVLMYEPGGQYVKEVVRMDKQPQHVALHQDRYLAVSNVLYGDTMLDVYDISQCRDL